jgi:putative protease
VRWKETSAGLESRLNGVLIDRYAKGEHAAYPTVCKGRYAANGDTYYAFEEPASLNTLDFIPDFGRIGVRAIKIEGRQEPPRRAGDASGAGARCLEERALRARARAERRARTPRRGQPDHAQRLLAPMDETHRSMKPAAP